MSPTLTVIIAPTLKPEQVFCVGPTPQSLPHSAMDIAVSDSCDPVRGHLLILLSTTLADLGQWRPFKKTLIAITAIPLLAYLNFRPIMKSQDYNESLLLISLISCPYLIGILPHLRKKRRVGFER